MKKGIALLLVIVALVAVFAGCEKNPTKTGGNIDSAISQSQASLSQASGVASQQSVSTKLIGNQKAEQIALNHAKLAADKVSRLYSKLDVDYGISEYDVEFISGGYEYEYEINAETGEIISYDKDLID